MDGFVFSPRQFNFNRYLPKKEDFRTFFETLEKIDDKALFLFFASSGLRRNEVLNLQITDIDLEKGICYPNHQSQTKSAIYGFFNNETKKYLKE
ncbi:MAG: hypothetical protein FJZ49_04400 [Candidatus Verstraetearchaeota archaeon]|nr:hypothetical protein [Candidatus Verstraetearchaeota archaeon]